MHLATTLEDSTKPCVVKILLGRTRLWPRLHLCSPCALLHFGDNGASDLSSLCRSEETSERKTKKKPGSKTKTKSRPASIPSCESLKSNEPKEAIMDSKRKLDKSGSQTRPGPSCESLKSDRSKDPILYFKRRTMVKPGSETKRKSSSGPDHGPSCESLKSDRSKGLIIDFKRDSNPHPALSCGSSLSDSSKDWDEEFKNSPPENMGAESSTDQLGIDPLLPVFTRLQEQVLDFAKEQLQSFHRALNSDYPECSERVAEEQLIREALLTIALHFLERMGEGRVAELLSRLESQTWP
uniref:Uncharacterized protein n=1 Tax=Knipowitschia caucasica TaxID=637954 RepID=A0AAV2ML50_KNICA